MAVTNPKSQRFLLKQRSNDFVPIHYLQQQRKEEGKYLFLHIQYVLHSQRKSQIIHIFCLPNCWLPCRSHRALKNLPLCKSSFMKLQYFENKSFFFFLFAPPLSSASLGSCTLLPSKVSSAGGMYIFEWHPGQHRQAAHQTLDRTGKSLWPSLLPSSMGCDEEVLALFFIQPVWHILQIGS